MYLYIDIAFIYYFARFHFDDYTFYSRKFVRIVNETKY